MNLSIPSQTCSTGRISISAQSSSPSFQLLSLGTLEYWQHQVLARMQSSWNAHVLLVGVQTGTAPVENMLTVSGNVEHPCSNPTPKIDPREKTTYSYKICMQIFITALFRIGKNWKQPKCFFSWWMDKQTVVHPFSRLLLSNKNEQTIHNMVNLFF